jgi:hypothetical protein
MIPTSFGIKTTLLAVVTLLAAVSVKAQKVANYSAGKYGSAAYEHFSFWVEKGKPSEITYNAGKYGEDKPVKYLGKSTYEGKRSFKIQLPDKRVLQVIPAGYDVKIVGTAKNYNKLFTWAYEGPVNGMGTFCEACAEDEKEAMKLLNSTYLK